jgi:hypothetical protein
MPSVSSPAGAISTCALRLSTVPEVMLVEATCTTPSGPLKHHSETPELSRTHCTTPSVGVAGSAVSHNARPPPASHVARFAIVVELAAAFQISRSSGAEVSESVPWVRARMAAIGLKPDAPSIPVAPLAVKPISPTSPDPATPLSCFRSSFAVPASTGGDSTVSPAPFMTPDAKEVKVAA